MKFGKLLSQVEQDMGDADGMRFVRYKVLKKQLKRIRDLRDEPGAINKRSKQNAEAEGTPGPSPTADAEQKREFMALEEKSFVNALNEDVQRFNAFFIEQEETNVIKLRDFEDRLSRAQTVQALSDLRVELVELHGHLVLLLHWSLINYAALIKILKKHDKLTGLVLKAPYLANVLRQPFASTGVLSQLVRQAEDMMENVKQMQAGLSQTFDDDMGEGSTGDCSASTDVHLQAVASSPSGSTLRCAQQARLARPQLRTMAWQSTPFMPVAAAAAGEHAGGRTGSHRQTKAAMDMWRTMRENASTPSTIISFDPHETPHSVTVMPQGSAAAAQRDAEVTGAMPAETGEGAELT